MKLVCRRTDSSRRFQRGGGPFGASTPVVLALCAGIVCTDAFAADPLQRNALMREVVDGYFLTTPVFPNERGEWQPSVVAEFHKQPTGSWQAPLTIELEYGITDRLQVSAEIPWLLVHDENGTQRDGPGDLSAQIFYNVIPVDRPVALSLAVEATLPSGDENRGLGEGETAFELMVVMAAAPGNFQLHLNIGSEWTSEQTTMTFGIAALHTSLSLWAGIVPTLELSGSAAADDRQVYFAPGLHWRAGKDFELGLGVPVGLTADADSFQVMAYYTAEF